MNNFEVVIGIEIHIELNTKTKMFSGAPIDFNAEPNTCVSPTDLAYPGTLPLVNKQAVKKAIAFSKALNMEIDDTLFFDRKNYFYPDLPKGYQITQDKRPIGKEGILKVFDREIEIERVHIEEDTAKTINKGDKTLLNYNRAGVPLIEVVTKPVIKSAKEAAEYVKSIRELAIALDISDAKMEEGSLRADINISLMPRGSSDFGTKVEIKNLNSIGNIEKSIAIEIKKQTKSILMGEKILMATKRFDEETQDTIIMRVKTDSVDYKFFPEPNIPPIYLGKDFIDGITLPELPWEQKIRYQKEGLNKDQISLLTSNILYSKYFDSIEFKDRNKLAKIFFAEIVSIANSENINVNELNIKSKDITIVLNKMDNGEISGKHIKVIFPLLHSTNMTVDEIIEKENMKQLSNKNEINDMLDTIIKENQEFVKANKERPERIHKFILGQLMKMSKGQANPVIASELVKKKMEG